MRHKPDSVPLRGAIICLCGQNPEFKRRGQRLIPYLALLRVEFTVPRTVTSRAVRSYRTLSPLPDPACAGHRRFALCCTGRGFPPQALPGTLPYGARTFLPSARLPRRGRRRSGDCLVSFGAQYRGFARPCHPALRIPIASVAAILREARQILS